MEGVEHDLVAYVELDLFATMFVRVVSLVDFCLEEVVVSLSYIVGKSFNDLCSIQHGFQIVYEVSQDKRWKYPQRSAHA